MMLYINHFGSAKISLKNYVRYFKPKTDKIRIRRWTERERAALIKGIEKYGIGKWEDIRNEFLPEWVRW
jgi:hypothetical protein